MLEQAIELFTDRLVDRALERHTQVLVDHDGRVGHEAADQLGDAFRVPGGPQRATFDDVVERQMHELGSLLSSETPAEAEERIGKAKAELEMRQQLVNDLLYGEVSPASNPPSA